MIRLLYFAVCASLGLATAQPAMAQARAAPAAGPVRPAPPAAVDPNAPKPDSAIAPLDRLEVKIFREPDLSVEDVLVDEGGHIALPLVGTVMAAGKSTRTLSAEISARLLRYLREPEVAVTLKEAASRQITVTGSVVQPGVYPLEGRLTLLQAVALARGPSQVASLDQVLIFRTREGQRTAARFDLDDIARGKAHDPEVVSGDTIAIGSSRFKTAWRDILASIRSFNIFNAIPGN